MRAESAESTVVITPAALLEHWQGHRRLTRRVIEAFPEDRLFTFSIGAMRPFGALAIEMLSIAEPMLRGIVTEKWEALNYPKESSKQEILQRWDEATENLNELFIQIPLERFQQSMTVFGQYPGRVYQHLLYAIDNEVHHRGQGYVYLRALAIEPPPFYER